MTSDLKVRAQAPIARTGGIEVLSIDQVPADQRHGRIRDQFTLYFSLNANIFTVVLGGVLVFIGLPVLWAAIAIVVGTLLGLVLVGFHAIQGPRLGVPQMIQSRGQFGFYGASIIFAVSIVLDFGFLAAQLVIQATALNLLVSSVSIPIWIAILAVPVVVLTIYGHDVIHLWQRIMTPILAVFFAVLFVQALRQGGLHGAAAGTHLPSFALFVGATGIFVVDMVSWAPYVSDYSRYLPANVNPRRVFWAVVAGAAVPAILCGVLGAFITGLFADEPSTIAAIADMSGRAILVIVALSLVGPNAANSYTGMLAVVTLASCFRRIPRAAWVRVVGSLLVIATGTLCALLGYGNFVDNLTHFLEVLLFMLIPWSAINLTDYYLIRRGEYDVPSFFTPKGLYGGVLWPGLVAYLLAVAAQAPFIEQTFYTGPLVAALGGTDISWIVGAVSGFVFYLIAVKISRGTDTGRNQLLA